jgi:hypothetical protein
LYLPIERQADGAFETDGENENEGAFETEGASLGAGEVVGDSESHLGKELSVRQSSSFNISLKFEQSTEPFRLFPAASVHKLGNSYRQMQ